MTEPGSAKPSPRNSPDNVEFHSWGTGDSPPMPTIDPDRHLNAADSTIDLFTEWNAEDNVKFVEENGRTYHKFNAGKYTLPNDQPERQRLELQQELFRVTFDGKLYLAPISPNVQNILDIATGTGNWAIEMANMFPNAQILGTDLSPIQPSSIPTNCHFIISDAELPWSFPQKFDFIHGRSLLACFRDPRSVIFSAFTSLAPGGYLELQDVVFPYQFLSPNAESTALYRWGEVTCAGATKLGRPWTNVQHYARWMEELGFEEVVERDFYLPTSGWAKGEYYKRVAGMYSRNLRNGVEGMSLKVLGALGWTSEDVRSFMVDVRREFEDMNVCGFATCKVVYGRKPARSS